MGTEGDTDNGQIFGFETQHIFNTGDLRIHPQVAGLVDADMRGKMMNKHEGPAS